MRVLETFFPMKKLKRAQYIPEVYVTLTKKMSTLDYLMGGYAEEKE